MISRNGRTSCSAPVDVRIRAESWLSASKLTPLEPARVSSQSIWATTGSEVRQPHVPRLRETSDRQLPVCTDRAKCPRPGLPHRPHNPDCARANRIERSCATVAMNRPRRVRRLHFLGGWSHGRWFNEEVHTPHIGLGTSDLGPVWCAAGRCPEPAESPCAAESLLLATDSVVGRSNQGLINFAAHSPARLRRV